MLISQHSRASLPCAVCGNHHVQAIAKKDRYNKPLINVMCLQCGLVWVDPQPSGETIAHFYSAEYRKKYKGAFQPKPKHCYRETLRAIDRTSRFSCFYKTGMRVIDIGSGAGFFAYVLKRQGITIDGIEPNKAYSDYAQTHLHLETIKNGFLEDISANQQYDLITINHVFEHLSDPRQAMIQMHKLLKKGGRILMEIPNIEATYHAPNKIFHVGHLFWYNPNTIQALARQLGFEIDDLQIVSGTQHINITLSKSDRLPASEAEVKALLSGNADRVLKVRQQHTLLKHFLTPVPYLRFFKKMRQYYDEYTSIKNFNTGKTICDSVCNRWLREASVN